MEAPFGQRVRKKGDTLQCTKMSKDEAVDIESFVISLSDLAEDDTRADHLLTETNFLTTLPAPRVLYC